jgi:GDSL-like Lipase/Acylhydrolase family
MARTGSDVQTVNVKDYLIASLGDSVASGEGNPDSAGNCDVPGPLDILPSPKGDNLRQEFSFCPKVNGQPSYLPSYAQANPVQVNFDQPTWWPQVPSPPSATADVMNPHITENQSQQCHRSTHAGPARAAYELQNDPAYNRDGTYGVTFLQLACSGASAQDGLLHGYSGLPQKPQGGHFTQLQPQLSDLQTLAAGRSVDAVTLNIGGNDIHFSNILTKCLSPYIDCSGADGMKIALDVAKDLKSLWDNLNGVANCLSGGGVCPDSHIGEPAGLGIAPSKVYLTTYFDPSQDENGDLCNYQVVGNAASLSPQEFQWANQFALRPLNATLKAAAAHGWNLVDVTPDFAKHGTCAKENWVNKFDEDFRTQGDQFGFFHPTGPGQDDYAKRILEALSANQLPTSTPSATGTTSTPSTTDTTGTTGTTTCGGISIFDYEQGDQCTHIGGLLTADGVQLTVGALTPGTNDSGKPELCAPVKGINTTSDPKFLTVFGFNLESTGPGPGISVERNGTPVNLQFPIGGTLNDVGTLAAGATVTGTVCFDAGITSGQQVLIIYSPAAQGRSIWVK